MTRADLELLTKQLRAETVKRGHLGGYNSEAECLMFLSEAIYKIASHLLEKAPRKHD
jgi:hypothetical protein